MTFLAAHARLLLVLHAVLGATAVAVTTHLAVWSWRLWRGDAARARGVVWFAGVGFAVYAAQFALGNVIYPVYRVTVRAEYLELPSAVAADVAARRAAHFEVTGSDEEVEPPRLTPVARLFDIKEHWVALGLPLLAGAWFLARRRRQGDGRLLLVCAVGAAGVTWFGAIVGLVVTSVRSIAGP